MNRGQPLRAVPSLLVLMALLVPFAAQRVPQTAAASAMQPGNGWLPIHPIAQAIWEHTDGPVARLEVNRGWLFGPAPLAMTLEPYDQSPTGDRQMVYFDKGRIDILNPDAAADDIWSAPGGQLVTEMLSGAVQLGADWWVEREPADIPLVGDPDQADAVTYATLGKHATLPEEDVNRAAEHTRIGQLATALLSADGTVDVDGEATNGIELVAYDDVTRHNIAAPFQSWADQQVYGQLYLLGHPLTEPYWVDAIVGDRPTRVLVQAFERRVMTYTPDNPVGWQTESGNTGLHYRAWRGLDEVVDPEYDPLIASIPFGEELVAAAQDAGIDPYLLGAIAEVTRDSGGIHLAQSDGYDLLGIVPGGAATREDPADQAQAGAHELARQLRMSDSIEDALIGFLAEVRESSPGFVADVIATRDLLAARRFAQFDGSGVSMPFAQVYSGAAAVFTDAYDADWWANNMEELVGWGGALPGATSDPLGYYCIAPGIAAGDRLRLVANGMSIDCTVGGNATDSALPAIDEGVVTLNRAAFDALGLAGNNLVRAFRIGPAINARTGSADQIDGGPAAYYAAGYDTTWWESTVQLYSDWGTAVAGWSLDPNGFYCVHPGYRVGQQLRLVANGVTLDCTVGDTVQQQHLAMWQSRWAIEMSWDTFVALGLPANNAVEVYALK